MERTTEAGLFSMLSIDIADIKGFGTYPLDDLFKYAKDTLEIPDQSACFKLRMVNEPLIGGTLTALYLFAEGEKDTPPKIRYTRQITDCDVTFGDLGNGKVQMYHDGQPSQIITLDQLTESVKNVGVIAGNLEVRMKELSITVENRCYTKSKAVYVELHSAVPWLNKYLGKVEVTKMLETESDERLVEIAQGILKDYLLNKNVRCEVAK